MNMLNLSPQGEQGGKRGYKIEARGNSAKLYIYDSIGYWGITAEELVPQIHGLDVETIHLHINSPGGDVFDARAIKTALDNHPAKISVHVDGLAASAASYIMLAGDEIEIADGAFVMIHEAWGVAIGPADEMRQTADLLERITDSIVNDYVASSNVDEKQLRDWMKAETWLDADQAVEHGFATSKVERKEKASASMKFDLSAFNHVPERLTNPPENQPAENEAELAQKLKSERQRQMARLKLYELN